MSSQRVLYQTTPPPSRLLVGHRAARRVQPCASLLLLLCIITLFAPTAAHRSPLVIVPGLGGSTLEARLDDAPVYRDCETSTEWYTIWASVVQGATRYDCFRKNIRLYHNASAPGNVSNRRGVEIRPRDFGGTGGIEFSNAGATGEPPIAYMHALVESLVRDAGYVRGVSVRAATNDFRAVGVPAVLDRMYGRLRALIEDTHRINNGSKVHLLSHSLGGPLANLFLNEMDTAWKARYIASHVMLSAPLLGSPVAIYATLSGPRYDYVPQFLPALVAPLVRTFPSIAWMWPRISAEGVDVWRSATFVQTLTKNYTLTSLKDLARDVPGASILVDTWDAMMRRTARSASDPGVAVLCMFANDTKTDLSIETTAAFNGKGTTLQSTWGDGTVSLRSLKHCGMWGDHVEVQPIEFGGSLAAHTDIVQNEDVIQRILAWLER